MSNKVYENPSSTEDLMELVKFVSEASQETVYKLADEVKEAGRRLTFLLDYAIFPGGRIYIHTYVCTYVHTLGGHPPLPYFLSLTLYCCH